MAFLAWFLAKVVLVGLGSFALIQVLPWPWPRALVVLAALIMPLPCPVARTAWEALGAALVAVPSYAVWFTRRGPGPAVRRGRPPGVALTFDDGPGAATGAILDVLQEHGAHASFFVIGRHAARYPDLVRRMVAEGHTVGLHGYRHAPMPWLGRDALRADLLAGLHALEACGLRPWALRPPWGLHSRLVREEARRLGLSLVLWTDSIRDWQNPGPEPVCTRILAGARAGAILLLHDASHDGARECRDTVDGLAQALPVLAARGTPLEAVQGP